MSDDRCRVEGVCRTMGFWSYDESRMGFPIEAGAGGSLGGLERSTIRGIRLMQVDACQLTKQHIGLVKFLKLQQGRKA